MALHTWLPVLLVASISATHGKWVRDVDSSIIEEIKQNPSNAYLIQFHAPWCGHCKKFESTYEEIAKEIAESSETIEEFRNLHVLRIDATVHSDVANYYDIRGFPTIKFISGSQILAYESERSKRAVLDFLRRANGPAVRWISSIGKFDELRHEHPVFFLLVTDETDALADEYNTLAQRYLSQGFFYATNASSIRETVVSDASPESKSQIFAIKTNQFYPYEQDESYANLEEFIIKEKVGCFPQVASGNIHDLIVTRKILVIYAFNDRHEGENQKQKRTDLKVRMGDYVTKHIATQGKTFQFAWSNDLDLLNNIAVWTFDEPLLFLYDSIQHKYGIVPLINAHAPLESILDHVVSNYSQIIQYKGDAWLKRLSRPFWDFYRTIVAMFIEAPLLSMLVIGLPASVLSIVCYCLCCLPNESAMDRDYLNESRQLEEDEDDDDDEEPKPSVEKKDD